VLEVGGPGSEPGSSAGHALHDDPFAAFGSLTEPVAEAPAPPAPAPTPPDPIDLLGSLPVTSLSDLERTGAAPLVPPLPPGPEPVPDFDARGDLSLEERTPAATLVREAAARWSDPDASQAIEVGPDGFQEVDLARGEARPDPAFDAPSFEGTREVPIPAPAPPGAPAGPSDPAAGPLPGMAAKGAPAPVEPPYEPTSITRISPARLRAAAMNVVSLAALLVVTLGLVLWWRGEGIATLLRWPGAGHQDLEVAQLASGVYEGIQGRPLVFVRGVVRATHEPVEGPVTVRVVLERGGASLGAASAVAGAVPSAEDLAAVASPEDLAGLKSRIEPGAPRSLTPGGDLPFLALFPLPAGDVGTIRFRVEPVPARGR
jgi:hypothetical protein